MNSFGGYEVVKQLSRRGTVATLKCLAPDGDEVILKVFESPTAKDVARVRSRADALAQLDHPGLARARGVVEQDGDIALVYEWVPGDTIATLIDRGQRFTDEQLYDFMTQVLEALQHAHSKAPAVIHRDLKPQNIVWNGERFVVIDFDAAREVFADAGTASVVGTTGYAGPEQFVGMAEPRSDQYGLAATALHMATHRHPTDYPLAGLRIDMTKTTLSVPMRRLLGRMLEPEVEDRFVDVGDALEAVETEQGLEPWQVAYEPLRGLQSSISVEQVEDELMIEIESRTSTARWMMFALGAAMTAPFYFAGTAAPAIMDDPAATFIVLPVQLLCFLMLAYFGSRARQEFRARRPSLLRVTRDSWELVGETGEVAGPIPLRALEHNAAASTGGVTPISIRQALAVNVGGGEVKFGDGLLPMESKVLVDVVTAFQSPDADEVEIVPEAAAEEAVQVEDEVEVTASQH